MDQETVSLIRISISEKGKEEGIPTSKSKVDVVSPLRRRDVMDQLPLVNGSTWSVNPN